MEENLEKNEPIIGKNLEILEVAKTIAKEKGISADEVLEAMEVAIAKAGRTKYGYELDIRAQIDKDSGHIGLYRYREIVESFQPILTNNYEDCCPRCFHQLSQGW